MGQRKLSGLSLHYTWKPHHTWKWGIRTSNTVHASLTIVEASYPNSKGSKGHYRHQGRGGALLNHAHAALYRKLSYYVRLLILLTGQEDRREGERWRDRGRERGLPLKSAGTRNFFLLVSGMLDLGTFSTITWSGGREESENTMIHSLSKTPVI